MKLKMLALAVMLASTNGWAADDSLKPTDTKATKGGNCEKRDTFETEEEFKSRCKVTPLVQAQMPKAIEQSGKIDLSVLQNTKKSSFETDEEYRTRRNSLLQEYNQAVSKRDPRYQAGIANLDRDNYDINSSQFPLFMKWEEWAAPLFVLEKGSITIQRQEAKALWEESVQLSPAIFVSTKLVDDAVVVDEAILLGINKEWKIDLGGAASPAEMLNPAKDSFESDQQFQGRKQKLLEDYRHAVQQHDPRFQAGTAILQKEKYSENSGNFPITIQWNDWARKQFDLLSESDIRVRRNEAIQLWQEGKSKPVFVDIEPEKGNIKTLKPIIVALNKSFSLVSLETEQQKTNREREQRQKQEAEAEKQKAFNECIKPASGWEAWRRSNMEKNWVNLSSRETISELHQREDAERLARCKKQYGLP